MNVFSCLSLASPSLTLAPRSPAPPAPGCSTTASTGSAGYDPRGTQVGLRTRRDIICRRLLCAKYALFPLRPLPAQHHVQVPRPRSGFRRPPGTQAHGRAEPGEKKKGVGNNNNNSAEASSLDCRYMAPGQKKFFLGRLALDTEGLPIHLFGPASANAPFFYPVLYSPSCLWAIWPLAPQPSPPHHPMPPFRRLGPFLPC